MGRRVEEIGRRIADKCKGLPLAAKTLGGFLQFKDTIAEWQEVLDSNIWQMEKPALGLFPHFYLSYQELSPAMKRCFSFYAFFPKDHVIDTDSLIRIWMAQGYLGVGERMERKGSEFVKNLVVRSFFEPQGKSYDEGGVIRCVKMHHLVHDFAQFLVKGECHAFVEGESKCESVESEGIILFKERRPRRHVMAAGKAKSIYDFLVFDIGNLRSLSLDYFYTDPNNEHLVSGELVQHLCTRLKSVRALTLENCELNELPRELGALIHLRFLDLSYNWSLDKLPETIGDLHYLESLDVTCCNNLKHLPERFGDLGRLRHFLNGFTGGLKQTQRGIENLTSLRVVKKFMPRTDGVPIDIIAKGTHLEELGVDFIEWNDRDSMDVVLLEMVEHMYLRGLTIRFYKKDQLPKGIVSKFVSSSLMTSLSLDFCYISSLPALGKLPSLQHLSLMNLKCVEHIGREFYGLSEEDVHTEEQCEDGVLQIVAFPALKTLFIMGLSELKTWEDICEDDKIINMPLLEKLSVDWCPALEALPRNILEKASHLKVLYINDCRNLKIEENWLRKIRTKD